MNQSKIETVQPVQMTVSEPQPIADSSSPDLRKTAVGSSVFLQIGCNYHTKWQSNKGMRFVLVALLGNDKAVLQTRCTNKRFTTKVSDLIFIETEHNKKKAKRLSGQ